MRKIFSIENLSKKIFSTDFFDKKIFNIKEKHNFADCLSDYKRNRRRLLWLALCLWIGCFGWLFALHEQATANAAELPFRLHIIANSNSAQDQAVKLMVRDAVVEYLTPLLTDVQERTQAEAVITENLPQLEALATAITTDYGYAAAGEIGTFDFPAKRYGQIVLPAGEYQALRLVLGEGEGHNWWCVLFPPLCFVDECANLSVSEELKEQGTLLQGDRIVRLKMYEIFYGK
jgi:stage II sporulation protein R